MAFGSKIGQLVKNGCVIYLEGTLGAGKTTFCRGIMSAFGYSGPVKSPTYTLVEPYELAGHSIFHFDLYRLGDPEELEYMGIRDYFIDEHICLVEWPNKGEGYIPDSDLYVALVPEGSGRKLTIKSGSLRGDAVIQCIT